MSYKPSAVLRLFAFLLPPVAHESLCFFALLPVVDVSVPPVVDVSVPPEVDVSVSPVVDVSVPPVVDVSVPPEVDVSVSPVVDVSVPPVVDVSVPPVVDVSVPPVVDVSVPPVVDVPAPPVVDVSALVVIPAKQNSRYTQVGILGRRTYIVCIWPEYLHLTRGLRMSSGKALRWTTGTFKLSVLPVG